MLVSWKWLIYIVVRIKPKVIVGLIIFVANRVKLFMITLAWTFVSHSIYYLSIYKHNKNLLNVIWKNTNLKLVLFYHLQKYLTNMIDIILSIK